MKRKYVIGAIAILMLSLFLLGGCGLCKPVCLENEQVCKYKGQECVEKNFWGNCVEFEEVCRQYETECVRYGEQCPWD